MYCIASFMPKSCLSLDVTTPGRSLVLVLYPRAFPPLSPTEFREIDPLCSTRSAVLVAKSKGYHWNITCCGVLSRVQVWNLHALMEGTPHSPPLEAVRPRREPLPANLVTGNFPHGVPSTVIPMKTGMDKDASTPRRVSSSSLLLRRLAKGREAPADALPPRKVPHSFLFTPVGPAASKRASEIGQNRQGGTKGGRAKAGLGALFAFSSSKKHWRV